MTSTSAVPRIRSPPTASPRRRPQTARPTTHPSTRARTTGTISARGAASIAVGKRARLVRGTLGQSNRRDVAEMGEGSARSARGVATRARPTSAVPAVGGATAVRRCDTVANLARSPTDASFAPMVKPQPPARGTVLNLYKDVEQSRPVNIRRRVGPRSSMKTESSSKPSPNAGKPTIPLMVLSPRQTHRQAPAPSRSPSRPEAPEPTIQARSADSTTSSASAEPPQPEPEQHPPQLQALSEPQQQERPVTPAVATPRFLHSALGAAKAARRRQALAANPKPGFQRRPQSAPADRRKKVATDRKGETREVTVADNLLLSTVDRRWAYPESSPVNLNSRTAQPGRYMLEAAHGDESWSSIGLSDRDGIISKLRNRMRENRLVQALQSYDPHHAGTIDAKTFQTCMHQLDVRLSSQQVEWIFSALSANGSRSDKRMDYSKFCEKLHADVRIGVAKKHYETHPDVDKWIFRQEELESAHPLEHVDSKAVSLLPREGVDPGYERSDVIEIEHPEPPAHFTSTTAPWSSSHTVMGSILAPDEAQTVKASRDFWARGKEGWVDQAGAERKAATDRYRGALRDNFARQSVLSSQHRRAEADRSAQRIAKRTMKQNFRRDIYEANASTSSHMGRKYAVARVYKAAAEKYGEQCYMDWDKQDLVVPAARNMPGRILDLNTEYTSTAEMFGDPANLDPTPAADPIAERLGHKTQPPPLPTVADDPAKVLVASKVVDTPVTPPATPGI